MNLLVDARPKPGAPASAGTHALLIGISDYPYLRGGAREKEGAGKDYGMETMYSPAFSAFEISDWLRRAGIDLPRPLQTCRLLVAPSESERRLMAERGASIVGSPEDCSFQRVRTVLHEWRRDAASHRGNAAWFYFAGHGIQRRPGDSVMLLSGYNQPDCPILEEAIAFDDVLAGMIATSQFPRMAERQYYLVDACRKQPRALRDFVDANPSMPWDIRLDALPETPCFCSPIFGATTGTPAYGIKGQPTVFGQALLRALRSEAYDEVADADGGPTTWTVLTYDLVRVLKRLVPRIAAAHGVKQAIEPGPSLEDLTWVMRDRPPTPTS